MADLIDRQKIIEQLEWLARHGDGFTQSAILGVVYTIKCAPAVDAVEVATLEKWLYEIAMNNIGCPVPSMAAACEIIISRLGGLRKFAEERREENAAD